MPVWGAERIIQTVYAANKFGRERAVVWNEVARGAPKPATSTTGRPLTPVARACGMVIVRMQTAGEISRRLRSSAFDVVAVAVLALIRLDPSKHFGVCAIQNGTQQLLLKHF